MTVPQVATAANHSLILDRSGEVFVCGENEFGQLGFTPHGSSFGDEKRRVAPHPMDGQRVIMDPTCLVALKMYHVRMISTSDRHTVCLCAT